MSLTSAAAGLLGGSGKEEPQITLSVDGKRYAGWTSVDLQRSLDMFSHSFNLRYIDRWAEHSEPWAIREGAACQLFFGTHLLTTGWVNSSDWLVSGKEWQLSASGRSKSGDLEDCSAILDSPTWKNTAPLTIVKQLIEPYGLKATSTVTDALTPLKTFSLEEGETVHEAIERLCTQFYMLAISNPEGNLELVRTDKPSKVVTLPVGECIQRKVSTNDQERFSDYYAIGQARGNANHAGEAVVNQREKISDKGVKRHRPIVILAAHSVAQRAQLVARATWERNVRAGRSMKYLVTLPGVLAPNKLPWTPGWHCPVKDEPLGVDATLVLTNTNVRANDKELVTELEFTLPEVFSKLEYPPKKKINPKPKPPKPQELCFSPEALDALVKSRGGI